MEGSVDGGMKPLERSVMEPIGEELLVRKKYTIAMHHFLRGKLSWMWAESELRRACPRARRSPIV
jgi:hypothetical protein